MPGELKIVERNFLVYIRTSMFVFYALLLIFFPLSVVEDNDGWTFWT